MPVWAPPLLAVQFLTRLPVPPLARLSPEQAKAGLHRAIAWLPLAGTLVGLITAGTYAAALLAWSRPVAAFLALAVEAWLTGAFHEDAVADFCDAFGGSASGEEARRILKDSRVGSYGALGLVLLVGLRAAAMAALPARLAVAAIVGAATMGRLWAVCLLALCPPALVGPGLAKDLGGLPRGGAMLAMLLALPGLAVMTLGKPPAVLASLVLGAVALPGLAGFLRRRIGGSTGDCLGFAAYLGQLTLLLAASAR